jgi:hypothetical protein
MDKQLQMIYLLPIRIDPSSDPGVQATSILLHAGKYAQ